MTMRVVSSKNNISNLLRNKTLQSITLINKKDKKDYNTDNESKIGITFIEKDEIFIKLIQFFNIREQFELMQINSKFQKLILNSKIYSKYLFIRSEFTGEIIEKEEEKKEEKKKKKRVHSISTKIKNAKVPDLNSIYNINEEKFKEKENNDFQILNNLPKLKLDLKNLNYEDFIGENGDNIKKFVKKYDLNSIEEKMIFNGLLEAKILETIKENSEFNIKNINIGSAILYFIHPFINLKINHLLKINVAGNQFNQKDLKNLSLILKLNSPTLRLLDLSHTNLDDESCAYLFPYLKYCRKISILNLNNNSIGSEGLAHLEKFFLHSEKLTTLLLRHNLIGAQGLLYLTKYLNINKKIALRTLDISYNGIELKGISILTEFIIIYRKIISLFIGGNYIKEEGVDILNKGLINNKEYQLSYLFLENSNLGSKGFEGISNIISNHPSITLVELKYNELFDEGGSKLFESLKPESKLLILDLTHNQIAEKTLISMHNYLKQNKNLRKVILNENKFDENCCDIIKQILLDPYVNIRNLCINNCSIEENCNLIFEGLTENKVIETLEISNNKIGKKKKKFYSILNCLKENSIIKDINLETNELHDDCLKILVDGILLSKSIKYINLCNNIFSEDIYPDIEKLVLNKKNIKRLNLKNSGFDEKKLNQINEILKNNSISKIEKTIKKVLIYDDLLLDDENESEDKESSETIIKKKNSKKSNLRSHL